MWHLQQIESWFQLVEKFEDVKLIENKNEWIVFGMEGKT